MDKFKDLCYWITLAHIPKWKTLRRNDLVSSLYEKNLSIVEFFELEDSELKNELFLTQKEVDELNQAKNELPNNSFLVEDLLEQGYDLIPILSDRYPNDLKKNLKKKSSPTLLYSKGDINMFNEDKVAIVGSREVNDKSIDFTKNVARNCVDNSQIVVSGFAKGTDRLALETALEFKGKSIIVLPQGITTFSTGFRKYYSQILDGDVVVVSTFHPKSTWSVGLAMARNTYIYGFANSIFVSQSSNSGGTWSGVIDGIKKERDIYIRKASKKEKCANNLLISKGAIAVDINGRVLESDIPSTKKIKKPKQLEIF